MSEREDHQFCMTGRYRRAVRLAGLCVASLLVLGACVGARVEAVSTPGSTMAAAPADAAPGGPSLDVAARPPPPRSATESGSRLLSTPSAAETATSNSVLPGPTKGRLVIHAVGDVNVDPSYIPNFRRYGYEYALSGAGGLFLEDSITIINLECPVSDLGTPLSKQFTFRCDPAALPAMRDGGVDVANLANNHSQDYGVEAMLDSLDRLAAHHIMPVGVGPDATTAARPALIEVDGWTVAVLGFGGVVPSPGWIAAEDRPGMADGDTIDSMVAAVAAADAIADLVIVTIHWGVELDTKPRADDIARAEAMIAAGADAIFGHHSHRLNPMTFVNNRPVAWGLGNFVWPRFSAAGSRTAVARVVVEPSGVMSACMIPAEIEDSGHPVVRLPAPDGCPPP